MAAKCFILALPLELRLEILELAVKVDKPIHPMQVTTGSNKFTWGPRERVPAFNHPGCNDHIWVPKQNDHLAMTSLSLTCKQIYEELKERPVFYQVNEFRFYPCSLLTYLAAITPERRSAIRNISVVTTPVYSDYGLLPELLSTSGALLNDKEHYKHILALLAHCRDLQTFTCLLDLPDYTEDYIGWAQILPLRLLNKCQGLAQSHENAVSVWSLPGFNIKVIFGKLDDPDTGNDAKPSNQLGGYIPSGNSVLAGAVRGLQDAIAIRATRKAISLREIFATKDVHEAATSAGLDFIGENRISLYRDPRVQIAIARRTRQQKEVEQRASVSIDSRVGTLKLRLSPRYDLEGYLSWRIEKIRNIKRTEYGAKCEVVWRTPGKEPTAWEDVQALLTLEGLDAIRRFYEQILCTASAVAEAGSPKMGKWLHVMQNTPAPEEIQVLANDMFDNKYLCATWRLLQKSFSQRVGVLRARINGSENKEENAMKKRNMGEDLANECKKIKT